MENSEPTTFTFKTTDPDEALLWLRAGEFRRALSDLDNELRNTLKHGELQEKEARFLSLLRSAIPFDLYNEGE
jgi:hypothetical protein